MTNTEIKTAFFESLEEHNYKVYDVSAVDGYFICDHGKDSITHFRIKGLWKKWLFGLWIHSDEEKGTMQLFCQYEENIDKFKPSRSDLLVSYDKDELLDFVIEDKWFNSCWKLIEMVKNHPFICYNGRFACYKFLIMTYLEECTKRTFKKYKDIFEKYFFLWYTKFKLFFFKRYDFVESVKIKDYDKDLPEWDCGTKYKVGIFIKDGYDDDYIGERLYKWFKKEKYGKYDYYGEIINISICDKENEYIFDSFKSEE